MIAICLILAMLDAVCARAIVGKYGVGETLTLQYDDYVYWGPLTAPAAFTLLGLRVVNATGTFAGNPASTHGGFDVFAFTQADWITYTTGTALLVPDFSTGISETRITGNYSYATRSRIITTSLNNYYIVFDNRARGGRSPDPGATVTITWTNFEWISQTPGRPLQQVADDLVCGVRNVLSGPGQYAYFAYSRRGAPSSVDAQFTMSGTNCDANNTRAYILDALQLSDFLKGGNFGIRQLCSENALCSYTGASDNYYFVMTTSNTLLTGCLFNYRVEYAATTGSCLPPTTPPPTTSTTTTTTSATTTMTTTPATPTTTMFACPALSECVACTLNQCKWCVNAVGNGVCGVVSAACTSPFDAASITARASCPLRPTTTTPSTTTMTTGIGQSTTTSSTTSTTSSTTSSSTRSSSTTRSTTTGFMTPTTTSTTDTRSTTSTTPTTSTTTSTSVITNEPTLTSSTTMATTPTTDCMPATERCKCLTGKCLEGLSCLSDVCVRYDTTTALTGATIASSSTMTVLALSVACVALVARL